MSPRGWLWQVTRQLGQRQPSAPPKTCPKRCHRAAVLSLHLGHVPGFVVLRCLKDLGGFSKVQMRGVSRFSGNPLHPRRSLWQVWTVGQLGHCTGPICLSGRKKWFCLEYLSVNKANTPSTSAPSPLLQSLFLCHTFCLIVYLKQMHVYKTPQ